jgi:hypothetical protein
VHVTFDKDATCRLSGDHVESVTVYMQSFLGLASRCEARAAELVDDYFDRIGSEPRAALTAQWQLDEAHRLIDLALAFGQVAERSEPEMILIDTFQ